MSPRRLLVSIIVIISLVLLHVAVQADEQSNVCVCMKKDDTPPLQKLTSLDVPEIGISIRIMQRIGTKYDTVGTFLLNDTDGSRIEIIAADSKGVENTVRNMFRDWISTVKTSSWGALIDSLKASELKALADDIQRVIDFCAEKNVDVECPVASDDEVSSSLPWSLMMMVTSVLFPVILGVAVFFQYKCNKRKGYTKYLKEVYENKMRLGCVEKEHWPPPVVIEFFRLAMIKKEKVQKYRIDDEYVRLTVTGKVDDILRKKAPIQLEEISDKMNKREIKTLLFEGAPGCGKSTLALFICKQWQIGKLFQDYEYVVLVKLRDNDVRNAKEIADILPKENGAMGRDIEQEIINHGSRRLLFIFDGWDEIPDSAPGYSLIMKILTLDKLSHRAVIITSRPTSSASLYKLVDVRIEILGFAPDQLKQYFDQSTENSEVLLKKIQENPAVSGSCFIPLNASILVHVFKVTGDLPKTEFGIFCSLIRNCIYRHQKKIKQPISTIESLDDLPEEVKGQFRKLCRLAYEAIMEDRIILKNLGCDFNTLGLLQGVESLTDGGNSLSHNFLHLSIQELLAALHMSTQLSPEEQVEQFRELFGRARFAAVFKFYAAKTKLTIHGMGQVLVEAVKKCLANKGVSEFTPNPDSSSDDSESSEKPKPLLLSLMACLYEAEDETLYRSVVEQFTDSKLDLSDISLNSSDCFVLSVFLAHCKQFDVDLESCSIHAEGCKTLFKPDEEYDLLSLDLDSNSIGVEGAVAISKAMKTMTNLQTLDLHYNYIGVEGAVAISEAMKTMTNLQTLDLSYNFIGDEGAVAISEAMKTMTNLQELSLSLNSICVEGAVAISEAMKTMTNLKELYLHYNYIGDEGAVAISEAMKTMTNLKELNLHYNSIGDEGAVAISEAMKTMTNLKMLDLNNNSIGDEGAVAISEAMKTMTNLKELNLGYNAAITEVGREALEEAAKLSGTKIDW